VNPNPELIPAADQQLSAVGQFTGKYFFFFLQLQMAGDLQPVFFRNKFEISVFMGARKPAADGWASAAPFFHFCSLREFFP
jgi:hypothetical protein